ncbi:MAG: Acyl-homoserine lactone [Rhodocyclales bacterium]|nr:Acyl-homoserine lactone [Rhodocyclales bacterium]
MNTLQRRHSCLKKVVLASVLTLASASLLAQTKLAIPAANVTASSSDAANLPGLAVDNNLSTHWTGGAASGVQWIQFNLGACYQVDYSKLAWFSGDARKYNVTLKASKDSGATWTTILTGTSSGTTAGLATFDFPVTQANLIRLESTGNNVNTKVSLSEAEFYSLGACGATSSSSSSSSSSVSSSSSSRSSSSSSAPSSSSSSSSVASGSSPAAFLGIQTWKLELPIGTGFKSALVLKLKDGLGTYSSEYFNVNSVNGQPTGVNFRSIAGGAIVGGTAYARSELREEDSTGSSSAAWSCKTDVRTMHIEQTLKHTTLHKAELGMGQIHDGSNDVVMIKYFGPTDANGVYFGTVNGVSDTGIISARFNNDTSNTVLDPAYKIGDRMTVDIKTTGNGYVTISYKNERSGYQITLAPKLFENISGSCYFKAGMYNLSCTKSSIYASNGQIDNSTCASKPWTADKWETDPHAYAESEIHKLVINPGPQ